jgi:hypothetical protein
MYGCEDLTSLMMQIVPDVAENSLARGARIMRFIPKRLRLCVDRTSCGRKRAKKGFVAGMEAQD